MNGTKTAMKFYLNEFLLQIEDFEVSLNLQDGRLFEGLLLALDKLGLHSVHLQRCHGQIDFVARSRVRPRFLTSLTNNLDHVRMVKVALEFSQNTRIRRNLHFI